MDSYSKLVRYATLCSVVVAVILIILKAYLWWITDSVSLQASLIDSILDCLASLVNVYAVSQALKPADSEHRFGHGKIEALAAFTQGILILFSSLWIFYEAVEKIIFPQDLKISPLVVIILMFSTLITIVLVIFQKYVIKQTDSAAIKADTLHYQCDIYINIGVIFTLMLASKWDLFWFDAIIGFSIGCYIIMVAWKIFVQALDILLDKELSNYDRKRIISVVRKHTQIKELHDMRTRSSGHRKFVQLHIELEPSLTLKQAHDITDDVEKEIENLFQDCEAIIHQDPYGVKDKVDNYDEMLTD